MKSGHPNFKQAQTTLQYLLGPIKIKDGLFMGDQFAAKDIEFIVTNKVTHVINTVSKAIPNLYQRFGVQYLSVHWTQKEQNVAATLSQIFDKKNNAVNAIFSFVEEAMEQGQSCLIHSLHGKSRATAVLVAYMMRKYSWTLNKCLELVNTKKEGLQIRNNYLIQMQELQGRMSQSTKMSSSWNQSHSEEEMLLANTYFNSKKIDYGLQPAKKQPRKRLTWDEKLVQRSAPPNTNYTTMTRFRENIQKKETTNIKSILKGCPNQLYEEQGQLQGFKMSDNNLVNNINGNIVHVTVNNFITTNTTDKKSSTANSKTFNSRPYSSDNKQRDKKNLNNPYDIKPNKLFPYDNPLVPASKTPYDNKLNNKIGLGTAVNRNPKKPQIKNPPVYQRPQSANINGERKKIKPGIGEQMVVMGMSGKKRMPSSNPKEDSFKYK